MGVYGNLINSGGVLVGVAGTAVVMVRRLVRLGLVAVILAVAPVAAAKGGPFGITIKGPGIHQPIQIGGTVTTNPSRIHYQLVEETRFFDLMFGVNGQPLPQEMGVTTNGDLYTVTWLWNGTPVPMEIYPYEIGGPLVHMRSGLHGYSNDGHHFGVGARGGWVRADAGLFDLMVELGVPLNPKRLYQPSPSMEALFVVLAAASVMLLSTVFVLRRQAVIAQ